MVNGKGENPPLAIHSSLAQTRPNFKFQMYGWPSRFMLCSFVIFLFGSPELEFFYIFFNYFAKLYECFKIYQI
jgi:hypothetical protein